MNQQPPDRVVIIGASAGGVSALSQLIPLLPTDSSAAFLVVTHIGRTPSELHVVLQ